MNNGSRILLTKNIQRLIDKYCLDNNIVLDLMFPSLTNTSGNLYCDGLRLIGFTKRNSISRLVTGVRAKSIVLDPSIKWHRDIINLHLLSRI